MTWLFPLYLAGGLAVLAPIWLHLRRQPPKERVRFSSLMFLEASERQPTRRRRLEQWLLLIARCLLLLLLAAMFARPFWRGAVDLAEGEGKLTVVLVDRSASMRRAGLWEAAVETAKRAVAELGTRDRVAVAVFDQSVEKLWDFETGQTGGAGRAAMVEEALRKKGAGWGRTDLGGAMVTALDWLAQQADAGARELKVVSDVQEGAELAELESLAWPEEVKASLLTVEMKAEDAGNFSLHQVAGGAEETEQVSEGGGDSVLRVRVSSARESVATTFELGWEGQSGQVLAQGYLPAGASRVLKLPAAASSQLTAGGTLLLKGDAQDFDNRLHLAPQIPREVRVRVVAEALADGGDEAASPLYYLQRVMQSTAALRPQLERVVPGSWPEQGGAALLVAPGAGEKLSGATLAGWLDWLKKGGLAVYVASGPDAAQALQALTPGVTWTVAEAERERPGDYVMLAEMQSGHPLLRPFADARLRDFTKVRFWRHRVLKAEGEGVEVLAKFDSGDPALLAVKSGSGTLLVLASGWQPAESQLALSTKFVPLWFGWLEAAGFAHEKQAALEVGDALPLMTSVATEVLGPDGEKRSVPAGGRMLAEQPGFYQLSAGTEQRRVAVQVPAAESRTSPIAEQRWVDLGVKWQTAEDAGAEQSAVAVDSGGRRLDGVATESQQRLWWWTLLGMLGFAAIETWLASRRQVVVAAN